MTHRAVAVAVLALLPLTARPAGAGDPPARVWLGADGRPLPFETAGQVVEFLATAEVISSEVLSTGITKPEKLLLERDGVRAEAIFHFVDRRERGIRRLPNGEAVLYLRDSYRSQIAAFELSRLLGMDSVPPTAERKVRGRNGSVQLWIQGAMTEQMRRDRGLEAPDPALWRKAKADQWIFDNLILNIDRNTGNTLIDGDWNVWLIDHTRCFGQDRKLAYPETITFVSRELWAALAELEPRAVRERLAPYLTRAEIAALIARHRLLTKAISERIELLSEDRVVRKSGESWSSFVWVESLPAARSSSSSPK